MIKKPMRAVNITALKETLYPCYAQPKIDAWRILFVDEAMTKSIKPYRNRYIQEQYKQNPQWKGLDAEIGVGDPTGESFYSDTKKAVSRIEGEHDFKLYVFDRFDSDKGYKERFIDSLPKEDDRIIVVESVLVNNQDEMEAYLEKCLNQGYEGIMLRQADMPYKQGTASKVKQELVKVKPMQDHEFLIVDIHEQMHNGNEATIGEMGQTVRSTSKEGKTGKDTFGSFTLEVVDNEFYKKGIQFNCGTGFTDELRDYIWHNKEEFIGKYATIRFQYIGSDERPRLPVFKGMRSGVGED